MAPWLVSTQYKVKSNLSDMRHEKETRPTFDTGTVGRRTYDSDNSSREYMVLKMVMASGNTNVVRGRGFRIRDIREAIYVV